MLEFVIDGYPGTGRRVEADSDLSQVYRPDLLQGAFMGEAVLRAGDMDLSTRFGWVTLIDWCLRLSGTMADLKVADESRMGFSESDDFIVLRRHGESLTVSCSYRPGDATVPFDAFFDSVRDFVDDRICWVASNFPAAMRNPAMPDVLSRIGRAFPLDILYALPPNTARASAVRTLMELYIDVQLDSTDRQERGRAVRNWFIETLSRLFAGLRTMEGVSWFASLAREEDAPDERLEGAPSRQEEFVEELSQFPYWAQLEFSAGELQLARIRSAHAIDGGAHSSLSTAMQCGQEALASAEYCAWIVESVAAALAGATPAFGRIEHGVCSDRANLDIALRRKPAEFLPAARAVLRGYAWVTICPEELAERLGGCTALESTGAFHRIIPLRGGGALLQATESLTGYSDEAMERVFRALALVLPTGIPKPHPAFPGTRFVRGDALQFR